MAFTGDEGEAVSLTDAAQWTQNFRDANPGVIKAHFLGKNKLNQLLTSTGCKGLRIYSAIDDAGDACVVVVAAKGNEDDNLNLIMEKSMPCPPYCGAPNALNGNSG